MVAVEAPWMWLDAVDISVICNPCILDFQLITLGAIARLIIQSADTSQALVEVLHKPDVYLGCFCPQSGIAIPGFNLRRHRIQSVLLS